MGQPASSTRMELCLLFGRTDNRGLIKNEIATGCGPDPPINSSTIVILPSCDMETRRRCRTPNSVKKPLCSAETSLVPDAGSETRRASAFAAQLNGPDVRLEETPEIERVLWII